MSDDGYFEDFGIGFEGTSVIFLNRSLEARHDTEHWSFIGRVQDYQMLDPGLPDDEQPYVILPQVTAIGRWADLAPGLRCRRLAAEAVNFDRDTGVTGVRVDVSPRSTGAPDRAACTWAPARPGAPPPIRSATRRLAPRTSPLRTLPILSARVGLRARAGRRLAPATACRRSSRVSMYLYMPYRDQDNLPVFDTGQPDLNLVQLFRTNRYVGADRVGDANQVSLGVTSRLLDAAGGRQFLSATLGQAFYFEDPRVALPDEPVRDRTTSDLMAELELAAFKNWNARSATSGTRTSSRAPRSRRSTCSTGPHPTGSSTPATGSAATCSSRSTCRRPGRSATNWRGYGRWVYSLERGEDARPVRRRRVLAPAAGRYAP